MRILRDAGAFEILTPADELIRQLLLIERCGRTCYQSLREPITEESAAKFVRMLMRRGHYSQIEHTHLTVVLLKCSRGVTHELVRHRLASYSQESTRYVDYARRGAPTADLDRFEISVICPPHRNPKEEVLLDDGRGVSFEEMVEEVERFYRGLRKAGWRAQDARQILPIGIQSEIVISANWREWRHIFSLRTDKLAHWEIRSVMVALLKELKGIIPVVFEDFVAAGLDRDGVPYYEKRAVG